MTVVVFAGPTLSAAAGRAELDAVFLPPAAQGDVYRAAQQRPRVIGIVDGYFAQIPAVWHKEILWAMAQGIHVYGAASMGALRAAELAPFGMVGVGAIFRAYRDGVLEADDEVAVAHASADDGFLAQSEALVNIRASLAAAEAAGVIAAESRIALERTARSLFYPERIYPRLLREAESQGLPALEIAALRAWLPDGRVDQKRDDALSMLRAIHDHLATDPPPKQVAFSFERTTYWQQVTQSASVVAADEAAGAFDVERLLDEARLEGDTYAVALQGAMLRQLALVFAADQGWSAEAETLRRTAEDFRRARGLLRADEFSAWLAAHHLDSQQFAGLVEQETLLRWTSEEIAGEARGRLPDTLRVQGVYDRLVERARDKRQVLLDLGLENPGPTDLGVSADELVAWHVARLGRPLPSSTWEYARAVGFIDEPAFVRALAREFAYARACESGSSSQVQRLNGRQAER